MTDDVTLIATLRDSSDHPGKHIWFENGCFVLEDGGSLRAEDVLRYDKRGQLEWAYDGLREWAQTVAGEQASGGTVKSRSGGSHGLVLSILSLVSFIGFMRNVPGVGNFSGTFWSSHLLFLGLIMPLVFAVFGFRMTGRELAQAEKEGLRRGVPMTGRVISGIVGAISGVFLILYLADFLGSRM